MFKCDVCGEFYTKYDYSAKAFKCEKCGHVHAVEQRKERCFSCGTEYIEYTWFDPSGCDKCRRSFVD